MKLSDFLKDYNEAANDIFVDKYYVEDYIRERRIPDEDGVYDTRTNEQFIREEYPHLVDNPEQYYEGKHKANFEKTVKKLQASNLPKKEVNNAVKNIQARIETSKSATPHTAIARVAYKDAFKTYVKALDNQIEQLKKAEFMKAFGPKIDRNQEKER
ncbi:hypothetical protein [Dyadobacter psychrotolerans]|uniref:Uncharacterized protein n=1 Tax=Dyadobacter psychrotolerans TaxID=2541721 RepID=A0A4R5E1K1_9BACT|nr:hypothetical protein [Dyadobacter psychrotolerans]TDE17683.1 hypothetical protein E0F88_07275 [Dyadobacter psychrotolerans]